jgi:tRNA threonylcarbamoyladenosine biosynthesis protein TsaB
MMSKPGMILCLETATTNCSVALSFEGKQIALKEDYDVKYSHAERLHKYIEEVLAFAKAQKEDISAIAISKGPGSYTGLRIGVSAAKGLCFGLDIPLISIPTLQSLAAQVVAAPGELVIPMLDARRMEVYSAVFDAQNNAVRDTQAEILETNSFSSYLEKGKVSFIGNGVPKFSEICKHPNAVFIEGRLPSAAQMCGLAYQKFTEGDFEDVAYFEPYYLKDFIAGKPKKLV